MAPDLDAFRDALGLLREEVDFLLDRAGVGDPEPSAAYQWHALTAEQAHDAWGKLIGWVDWLVDRYGLEEILPVCWYRHGPLVEELTALRAAWLGAYTGPQARPADAAGWHDQLDRTLERVPRWDRNSCAHGSHRDDVPLPRHPGATDERAAYVRADVAARNDDGGTPPPSVLH